MKREIKPVCAVLRLAVRDVTGLVRAEGEGVPFQKHPHKMSLCQAQSRGCRSVWRNIWGFICPSRPMRQQWESSDWRLVFLECCFPWDSQWISSGEQSPFSLPFSPSSPGSEERGWKGRAVLAGSSRLLELGWVPTGMALLVRD